MTVPAGVPAPAIGPYRVKVAFKEYLEQRIPVTLAYLRPLLGVTVDELPDPVSYMRNPPLSLDRFPRLAVEVSNTINQRRTEQSDDGEWFTYYGFTLYAWCRADAQRDVGATKAEDDQTRWEAVLDQRDHMIAALRYSILNGLHLGVQPAGIFAVDEDSLVEGYTEPTAVKGDRWVAGATLRGRVRVLEAIEGTRVGTVQQIHLDVVPQPPPNLGDPGESISDFNLSVHPALL